ncbi:MAG: hypothetical protein LQ339_000647 [Xanthoria mediterranea]|nr:MAG: hypothetical protein LQ339_000647 [Xanthoria mediterranea]
MPQYVQGREYSIGSSDQEYHSSHVETPGKTPSFGEGGWGKASFSVELTPEELALKHNIQQRQRQSQEALALRPEPRAQTGPQPTKRVVNLRYYGSNEHIPQLLPTESSFRVDLSWDCQKCQAFNHRDRHYCQNCNRSKHDSEVNQWRCPSCGWHNTQASSRCNKCNSFHVEDGQMARIAQQWKHVSRYNQRLPPAATPALKNSATTDVTERSDRERKIEDERTRRLEQTRNGRFVAFKRSESKAETNQSQSQGLRRSPFSIERPPVTSSIRLQRDTHGAVLNADRKRSEHRLRRTSDNTKAPLDRRQQEGTPLADNISAPSYSGNPQQDPPSQSANPLQSKTVTPPFRTEWGSYGDTDTALSEAEKNQRPLERIDPGELPVAHSNNPEMEDRGSSISRARLKPRESDTTRSPRASNRFEARFAPDTSRFQSIDPLFQSSRTESSRESGSRLSSSKVSRDSGNTQDDISWLEVTSSRPSSKAISRDRERESERSRRKAGKAEVAWKGPRSDQTPPAASSYYSAATERYAPGGHGQFRPSFENSPVTDPDLTSNQSSPLDAETTSETTSETPEPKLHKPQDGSSASGDALSDANFAPFVKNSGFASAPYHRSRGARTTRRVRHRDEEEEDYLDEDREDSWQKRREQRKKEKAAQKRVLPPTPVHLPEYISVGNLARVLRVRVEDFSNRMQSLGFEETNNNHVLNSEDAGLIAAEFNFEPIVDTASEDQDLQARPPADDKSLLPPRPPIVTIMGHVDHGKTTLLDYLRKSSVAASEHGGITQHIGAFSVPMPGGRQITFLDTPGHAAFLSMRQRGANVTDIVILVVAADDSVKPQTVEAIKHAQTAKVPMIVAINKIDKEDKNIDRVKQDLARYGVEIEDYGGDTQVVCVSGKTGQGLDELEDAAVALADVIDMRAEVNGQAEGWVLEATTKRAGRVATVLVKRGTIRRGDIVVAGSTWAKIRTLKNEAGVQVPHAGPGIPVEVDGWKDQPTAGDEVLQADSEQLAKSAVDFRLAKAEREQMAADMNAANEARSLEQGKREAAQNESSTSTPVASAGSTTTDSQPPTSTEKNTTITLPLLLKADVSGSIEACLNAITALGTPTIHPQVLRSAVGPISESDISLAASSGAHIVNFNQTTAPEMARLAERQSVKLVEENVIYRLTDLVKVALEALLPVKTEVKVLGEAEIAKAFEVGVGGRKKVWVAGCRVRNGVIGMNAKVRVLRGGEGGEVVFQGGHLSSNTRWTFRALGAKLTKVAGQLISLKNIKKDINEARKGMECGMSFDNWSDFKEGDQVQSLEEKEIPQHL